jgi:hypothetical protein
LGTAAGAPIVFSDEVEGTFGENVRTGMSLYRAPSGRGDPETWTTAGARHPREERPAGLAPSAAPMRAGATCVRTRWLGSSGVVSAAIALVASYLLEDRARRLRSAWARVTQRR